MRFTLLIDRLLFSSRLHSADEVLMHWSTQIRSIQRERDAGGGFSVESYMQGCYDYATRP